MSYIIDRRQGGAQELLSVSLESFDRSRSKLHVILDIIQK